MSCCVTVTAEGDYREQRLARGEVMTDAALLYNGMNRDGWFASHDRETPFTAPLER